MSKPPDQWASMLADAADRIEDARKQLLDRDDVEACHGYVDDAFQIIRELNYELDLRNAGDDFEEFWARQWFHEATLLRAFTDSLSREPFLTEGAYRWRVRSVTQPPLKLPDDERERPHDGAQAEIEVGTNTSSVIFTVSCDSTYNKHVS